MTKLSQGEVDELRVEVNILKKAHPSRPNISREERIAIRELKKYITKAEDLLNQPTYKILPADPTSRQNNKLINLLKTIEAERGISEEIYRRLYPTGAGSSKNPQRRNPPETHSSTRGTVSYATVKELASILKPFVRGSTHHVQNTNNFVQHLTGITLLQDECIISFDVKASFTPVPITSAINTIRNQLTKDQGLHHRTSMTVQHIICLLLFCLKNTYFVFQSKYYEQLEGTDEITLYIV